MNCHEFESHLEGLLDEQLDLAKRQTCLEHASTCPACGELLAAVGGVASGTEISSDPLDVAKVLELTIGSACGRAKERLPAFVDRELTAADRELVDLHLASCTECSELATTLAWLRRELPSLAEVPVDERFTRQVLAVTLPIQTRFARWWQQQWAGWIRRPRFAMEAAYVGLLFIMMVLGAFSTPVSALPQKGLELMQTDPDTPSVWTQANDGLGTFWEAVASLFENAESEPESSEESP